MNSIIIFEIDLLPVDKDGTTSPLQPLGNCTKHPLSEVFTTVH